MLRELLLIAVGLGVTFFVVCALVGMLGWRWLRRRNRVGRYRRAPIAWLWSPGRAARLHRRLRRVCEAAALAGSLRPLAETIRIRAEMLDAELAHSRRYGIAELAPRVTELEVLTGRIRAADRHIDELVPRAEGDPLSERLDALEAAVRELSQAQPQLRPPARR